MFQQSIIFDICNASLLFIAIGLETSIWGSGIVLWLTVKAKDNFGNINLLVTAVVRE